MPKIFEGKVNGEEIEEGDVILINVPSAKLIEINTNILKWYISEKKNGAVYVTVNKPFSTLIKGFKQAGIDTSKIFIIDAVTPSHLVEDIRTENAVLIGSPKELTNISITTTSTIQKLRTAKILIFDSVNTLLFYNDFESVKNFIRFISNKMKELKVTFAIICIKDKTDEKMIFQLSSFVDKIIEVE